MMVRAPRAVDLVANSGALRVWRRWAVFSLEFGHVASPAAADPTRAR